MNKIILFLLVFGILSCQTETTADKPLSSILDSLVDSTALLVSDSVEELIYPIDTVVLQDINGDKINDTVFINEPSIIEAELSCRDEVCNTKFIFANTTIPSFSHEQALGGVLANAGDLDDDGMCELYFVPDWFTSNWTGLTIYSLKKTNGFYWGKVQLGERFLIWKMNYTLLTKNEL
ncbi:MAG: hypothetical protein IPG89_11705 [Bacteroidetes bacterium]|nr:hypothetical protein [Bacteroidota bacterium]